MKSMLRVLLAFLTLQLAACAVLQAPAEKAAKAAGRLVTGYCDNVTDPDIREQIRERVNFYAAPNAIMVQCSSGGPALVAGGNQP